MFAERCSVAPLRLQFEACLQRAVDASIDGLSGSCKDILEHKLALWTFSEHDGVEPTNNHAERELRGFVLWRKICFGTQSERGNIFAARVMTVAYTARKQNKSVFGFFTECFEAWTADTQPPSIFGPSVATAVAAAA